MDQPSSRKGNLATLGIALLVLGGALFIIGAFVPAARVKLPTGSSSSSLWDQDWEGIASLSLGIVLLLAAVWAASGPRGLRAGGVVIMAAGAAGSALALYKILNVESEAVDGVAANLAQQQGAPVEVTKPLVQQLFDSGQASVSVRIGLYLVLIAGVLTIVGGLMLAMSSSRERVTSNPPPVSEG